MKEIEEKAKRYDEALARAGKLQKTCDSTAVIGWCEYIFPELKESEDERIRKALVEHCKEQADIYKTLQTAKEYGEIQSWIAWLEKQKTSEEALQYLRENHSPSKVSDFQAAMNIAVAKAYDKGYNDGLEKQGTPAKLSEEEQNRFAKSVLTSCASSFIDYLDAHKYEGKMCVSNGECEDIENAFNNAMWDRLHRYYCKYIEKQGEQILANSAKTCKDEPKVEPKFHEGDWVTIKE